MEEVDTGERAHPNWPDRFFAKIVDGFLLRTANVGGIVGDAKCYLLSARELLVFAQPIMETVAVDPVASADLHEMAAD